MKATSSYKMSKQTKYIASGILDAHARGSYKRMMIEAELAAIAAKQKAKFKKADVEGDEA